MIAPLHDLMGGIVEEIVRVEFQHMIGGVVVIKKVGAYIDRRGEIDTVVPEVKENHPFFKEKRAVCAVVGKAALRGIQKPAGAEVGSMRRLRSGKAPETDMFSAIGDGRTVIAGTVLFFCRENAV